MVGVLPVGVSGRVVRAEAGVDRAKELAVGGRLIWSVRLGWGVSKFFCEANGRGDRVDDSRGRC